MLCRSATLTLASLAATTSIFGGDQSHPADADQAACTALFAAAATRDYLTPDDPSYPRWYCDFRPLRDTDKFIVIVLRDTAKSGYVGHYSGWYAIRRSDYAVYEIASAAAPTVRLEDAKLVSVTSH